MGPKLTHPSIDHPALFPGLGFEWPFEGSQIEELCSLWPFAQSAVAGQAGAVWGRAMPVCAHRHHSPWDGITKALGLGIEQPLTPSLGGSKNAIFSPSAGN